MDMGLNEQILENVSPELIRPLLALCMRTLQPNSTGTYEQLIQEIQSVSRVCHNLEEELLCTRLKGMAHVRMQAMRDAQEWVEKQGDEADSIDVHVNRWYVEMLVNGENRAYVVSYVDDGVDRQRMERKVKALVVEATEGDTIVAIGG